MNSLREEIKNIATRYGMREITWEVAENELVVLFQKYADEVIGENEKMEREYSPDKASDVWSRNILRSEQRERGKKLAG